MNWAAIKPILAEIELYTSLLINTYVVLFALTYSLRWLVGRARKVTPPPSDVLASAISDAFSLLVLAGLVIASAMALLAMFGDLGVPDVFKWITELFS